MLVIGIVNGNSQNGNIHRLLCGFLAYIHHKQGLLVNKNNMTANICLDISFNQNNYIQGVFCVFVILNLFNSKILVIDSDRNVYISKYLRDTIYPNRVNYAL